MTRKTNLAFFTSAFLLSACAGTMNQKSAAMSPMTFFVTSAGSGKGADLGGLSGADRICQDLATAMRAGDHTWHAYLSTTPAAGAPAVNARDRIGRGPWQNAKGVVIAESVDDLHSANNKLDKQTAITEKGEIIPGRGDAVTRHDILTGSSPEGRAMAGDTDTTCSNWTSSGAGSAIVGHHDRQGLQPNEASKSWNSSHPSRGCSQENLVGTGGAGYFYCFAVS